MKVSRLFKKLMSVLVLVASVATSISAQKSTLFMAVTKNGNTGYITKSQDNGKTVEIVWDGDMDAASSQNRLFDIAYGDGKIVAVGNSMLVSEDNGKTWSENNLYTYTGKPVFSARKNLSCVTYGDGFFVAASSFHFIYSKDGKNWKFVRSGKLTAAEENAKKNPSGLSLADIKKDPKLHSKRPSVGEFPPEIHPGLKTPRAITFAKGKFYVVGGNGMMTGKVLKIEGDKIVVESDLGFTGNAAKLTSGGLQQIEWDGSNTLVATSISTKSTYSTDTGKSWKYMHNPDKNQIWALAFNNGKWVAASPFEGIFSTNDIQLKWTNTIKRGGGRAPVNDMIFANGNFILVGNDNAIIISVDAENWQRTSKKDYGFHIQGLVAAPLK